MTSAITTQVQKLAITEVEDVVVTDVVSANGVHSRAIRIYGTPLNTEGPPVFELILHSDMVHKIKLGPFEVEA